MDELTLLKIGVNPLQRKMPIKRLPESVISRIAAGEVITSPYNIIKELLENSLDAHSTSITISIDSSLKNLSIRDNGAGIEKDDLEFLCLNHYTSKIQSIEDLKKYGSITSSSCFGFRGEALHSISLCSHIKIQTKTSPLERCDVKDGMGHVAIYNSDRLIDVKECAFDGHGTFIEIKNIFYNNTIRSEYFSKNRVELLNCIELVAYYGIIYNSIECKVDNKVILGRDPCERGMSHDIDKTIENRKGYILKNILNSKNFLGKNEHLRSFYRFRNSKSHCVVDEGFIIICSELNAVFKSSKFILFVNRRLVKNDSLKNRVLQKYRCLKKGCVPFAIY
ncbi:DNA mismatch repair protein MutL [Vittaforma corneae ATCC 50505]|uniref:DNA mismatch repair protein MutL n=1 Tax=Vittaforma corneae (strain ATCC 50505) TaxID=993615 RepID=L2GQW6_VITCO|nr:DNA mismatch repair protein MutL [Vittaforma corneae ATCC 50505]ELA42707.1 DNA mismatch repair protein MutL [Vittaforma corneae ATCC 50505]